MRRCASASAARTASHICCRSCCSAALLPLSSSACSTRAGVRVQKRAREHMPALAAVHAAASNCCARTCQLAQLLPQHQHLTLQLLHQRWRVLVRLHCCIRYACACWRCCCRAGPVASPAQLCMPPYRCLWQWLLLLLPPPVLVWAACAAAALPGAQLLLAAAAVQAAATAGAAGRRERRRFASPFQTAAAAACWRAAGAGLLHSTRAGAAAATWVGRPAGRQQ